MKITTKAYQVTFIQFYKTFLGTENWQYLDNKKKRQQKISGTENSIYVENFKLYTIIR
jgi:hypothetical protein